MIAMSLKLFHQSFYLSVVSSDSSEYYANTKQKKIQVYIYMLYPSGDAYPARFLPKSHIRLLLPVEILKIL